MTACVRCGQDHPHSGDYIYRCTVSKDGKTEKTMNTYEYEARVAKAHAIATFFRKQRWTADDLANLEADDLKNLAEVCGITRPSRETVAMAQGMLIAQPPFKLTAEEMLQQEAEFDAHLLRVK